MASVRTPSAVPVDAASKQLSSEEAPEPNSAAFIDIGPRNVPTWKIPDNFLLDQRAVAQAPVSEKEPNDSAAVATSLGGTNVVAKGNIYKLSNGPAAATGDLDYWSFSGTAGDRVYAATMSSWAPSSSTDTTLELFNTDGTTVIETDLDDGSFAAASSSIAGATLPSTGTYYLRVRQASNTSRIAPYFLHVRLQGGSPTPEAEANDTAATANPLPANGWVSGTHGVATDADFFSFSASAGDTIYVSLDADPERDNVQWNPRMGVGLFGDASSLILVVDDASVGSVANPLSEAHFVTVKSTGTYYAYVDTTAQTSGGPTQTYNLSVSVHPATPIGTNCTVYSSTDVPKTIGPAAGTVTNSTITIPGNPRIEDLNVSITLDHTIMADIDAALLSPAGNENSLFTDIGASAVAGQALMDLDLDDEAGIPPLFTVVKGMGYQPELNYRLAWLKGENAGGTWTLRLRDDANATNGGNLTAWSITVCEPPAAPVCSGTLVTRFATDFEANNGGFTTSAPTPAPWQYGTPTAAPIATCNSGVACWKTNLTGLYSASANQDLISPTINLSGLGAPVTVSWAQKYQLESASFDTVWLDVREVGPTNVTNLFQHLDATMTDSVGSPATTINETAGWGVMTRDISAYANKSAVQLRWGFVSDSSGQFAGVAIDDVAVTACCTPASCDDNNPCTDDVCDTVLGCTHVNNDTAACSDGNACTGPDVCAGGLCVPGPNPCDDSNACTVDVCDGQGGCTFTAVNCDDGNACTDDSCSPATGCGHANNTGACSDGNVCTLGDVCAGGVCVPGAPPAVVQFCDTNSISIPTSGTATPYPASIAVVAPPIVCSVTVNLNGITHTFPDDIDVLLAAPAGQNAIIMSDVGGGTDVVGVNLTLDDAAAGSVPDAGPLVSGTFKPTNIGTGDVFAAPAPAPLGGSALSVFNATNPNGTWNLWVVDQFTGDGGSMTGWCVNISALCSADADCSDGNACTDDACVAGACTHSNNTGSCDDGNACTANDTCTGGVCVGGAPPSCDDGDVCTTDSCNAGTGQCDHVAVVCNDGNVCTDDVCVGPATGCVYTPNNAPCSDNDSCTQTDACAGGVCVGSNPTVCDDGEFCTTDSCDPATGLCVYTGNTNTCDDGNVCTTGDVCGPRVGENFDGVTIPNLPAGWTATLVVGLTGDLPWYTDNVTPDTAPNTAYAEEPAHVTDNVLDSPALSIATASAKLTFKNRFSTESTFDGAVLEISIGGGAFTDIVTAGGSFASGGYTGVISSAWGSPIGGRSAWTGNSTGYPAYITTIVNLPAAAAGQSVVLRWRLASDSSVGGTGQDIDTIVVVDPTNTCAGTPACDDGNPCTNDSCDPQTGACTHTDNTDACDDGNACTTGDACANGSCQPGTPAVCDDANVCTDDACDPQTGGCVFANNTAACDDGDPCTAGDVCGGGSCQPGTPITAPAEVAGIVAAADKETYSWSSALYATQYDAVRGLTNALPVGPGGGDEICFGDLGASSLVDAAVPASGDAFWYLVRGENTCGIGTYGTQSNGSPRVTTTCP